MYCGSVQDSRDVFMNKLEKLLGGRFKDLNHWATSNGHMYVLGCEVWEEKFEFLLVFEYTCITNLWEVRKVKLYRYPCCTQS